MMHKNITPDEPPPGNPSSMPGWNSQWSLEHQQFYYVNTSTGERRWYLPTASVTTPRQDTQVKPVQATPPKIHRKAVGAQSIRSNQASPVSITQNFQANTGTVRAPLPQGKDSYFPPPTVQTQCQATQVELPLTPAPTPTQYQAPPATQAVQSPDQQLDFSGRFAKLSVDHSQANPTTVPGAWPQQAQSPQNLQSTQPPPSVSDVPMSPMSNQPNAHNFSSQPSTTYNHPPPPPIQYQSLPSPQSPDQSALPSNAFTPSHAHSSAASSPMLAPQPVLQRFPPPPPPRNLVQHQVQHVVGQCLPSPMSGHGYSANLSHMLQHSTTSQSPVIYQQHQSTFKPDSTQPYQPVPGDPPPAQQQEVSGALQTYSQEYFPPPNTGSFQQAQQNAGQQPTTSPQLYATPSQSPASIQYRFPPPPPPVQQHQQQVPGGWPPQSQSVPQQNSPQAQNPAQIQKISPQPTPVSAPTSSFPSPPGRFPQQQQNYVSGIPAQYNAPQGTVPAQTTAPQHYNTTNPTPPPLHHYSTAPIPVQGPYQPPIQQSQTPSAPPLHRYSSAPEAVVYQQGMIPSQTTYSSPPGPVGNPYAQQVAHANSFYGPPPQRTGSQGQVMPQRIPVQFQNQTSFQQQQGNFQHPVSPPAHPQQIQGQSLNQPQYQTSNQYHNPAQYQNPNQPQAPYQTNAPTQPQVSQVPLAPPRKSSSTSTSVMMNKMGRQFSDFSKSATEKTKRFSVSQPGLKKWGTRAAVGIAAVGALALGVDAMGDAAGMFEGAGGGEAFSGGGADFSGGGGGAEFTGDEFGGGADLGGGGGEGAMDAQTAVDANAAQLAMEQAGQENALMLTDPVGTEYETVYDARATSGVNALI